MRVGPDLLAALIDQHVALGVATADRDARAGAPPGSVQVRGELAGG